MKWPAYFFAPLVAFSAVILLLIFGGIAGLLLQVKLLAVIVAIFWPILLLGCFGIAVLLLGLLFGWPLIWPTISTEGTDSFDGLSRSYSYTFQRPLYYLFYVLVAGVIGVLAAVIAWMLADWTRVLAYWGVSLGAGDHDARRYVLARPCERGAIDRRFHSPIARLLGRLRRPAGAGVCLQLLLVRRDANLFPAPPARRWHRARRSGGRRNRKRRNLRPAGISDRRHNGAAHRRTNRPAATARLATHDKTARISERLVAVKLLRILLTPNPSPAAGRGELVFACALRVSATPRETIVRQAAPLNPPA